MGSPIKLGDNHFGRTSAGRRLKSFLLVTSAPRIRYRQEDKTMAISPAKDVNVMSNNALIQPSELEARIPLTAKAEEIVLDSRRQLEDVLSGDDERFAVIVGPCSIHDKSGALDYAARLKPLADRLSDRMMIVMRVYFEKPRTHRRLEGPYLRPQPQRHVPDRRRSPSRPADPVGDRGDRTEFGHRIPRPHRAPVRCRPRHLGRHRGAHHREPDSTARWPLACPCPLASKTARTATRRPP